MPQITFKVYLSANVVGIHSREQGGPRWRAVGLDVALLQAHPGGGEVVDVRGQDLGVVVADIVVPYSQE